MLFARAFDEHVELAPDEGLVLPAGDLALRRHQLSPAVRDDDRLHLAVLFEALRGLLVRVLEDADVIELGPLDEAHELAEVGVGLAGVADDERRPEEQVRYCLPPALDHAL